MQPGMGARYRKTPYGWEPVQDWSAAEIPPDPEMEAQEIIRRLVTETIACGVPLDRAVKYWDYILRKA